MTHMARTIAKFNRMFDDDGIQELTPDVLPPADGNFRDAVRDFSGEDNGAGAILEHWPDPLRRALRGALESAVERNVPVTFAWMPGYDYEMTISEWANEPGKPCGITILLRSRHADDARVPE